jgi:hypothetical protein
MSVMQESEVSVPQEVGQSEVPVGNREHESVDEGALDAPGEESDIPNPDLLDELPDDDPDPDAPPELEEEDRDGSS